VRRAFGDLGNTEESGTRALSQTWTRLTLLAIRPTCSDCRVGTAHSSPLPIETVRDLLGIVRTLYVLHRNKGNHGHARALHGAGTQLRRALELAVRRADDANANAEAWRLSNLAIVTVARVQGNFADDLAAVVRLASDRVQRRRPVTIDRDAKRHARIKRG